MTARDDVSVDKVLAALRAEPRTVNDIAEVTRVPAARVYDVLRRLHAEGKATREGGGRHARAGQKAIGWTRVETRPGERGEHAQPVRSEHAPTRPSGVETR